MGLIALEGPKLSPMGFHPGIRASGLLILLLVAGCGRGTAPGPAGSAAGAPVRGGTLNLALADDVKSLDPALAYDTYSIAFVHATTARLLDYSGTRLVPELAERWEISPDRKQYTFHLRPGLKYADGRPLVATDFAFGIEQVLGPSSRSPGADFFALLHGVEAFRHGKKGTISGIQTPDRQTIRFILDRPSPTFLNVLALTFAAPLPYRLAAMKLPPGDVFEEDGPMVDSGPFVVKSHVPGQRLRLERNPYFYRQERPYLDAVDLQIGVEERVQVLRFENGQIDVLHYIPSADYPQLKADPKWASLLVEGPGNTVWFLGMNTRMKPFDNLKVRQAVVLAVDQAKMIRLLNGRGRLLADILPPTVPGYNPAIQGCAHDPARARALLAEAGHPSGFSTTLWVAAGERYEKIAQGVQADLKAVGIDAPLKPAALPTYLSAIHKADTTPIFYGGWFPDFPDPGNFLDPLFNSAYIHQSGSTNSSFLADPAVDRLLNEGAAMPAGEARLKVYQRAEGAIVADAPWAPLYQEVESRLRQPNIGGVTIDPVWPYLRLAEIWKRATP